MPLATPALAATKVVVAVGGGAFGQQVRGAVNSGPSPSASLPPGGGGPVTAEGPTPTIPGVLKGGLLKVEAKGGNVDTYDGFAQSSAETARIAVGRNVLTADALKGSCRADANGTSGSVVATNLKVGTESIPSKPHPNTQINLADAIVVINEQIITATATGRDITVNALRVTLTPGTEAEQEVIVAQSRCAVTTTSMRSLVWDAETQPTGHSVFDDGQGVELGMRFTTDVPGYVSGVRFYKDASMTGPHVGRLWRVDDQQQLASATFVETASGWQEVTFPIPVRITPGTTYVVSYNTPDRYVATAFWTYPNSRPPLHTPTSAFTYGPPGAYPATPAWTSPNYWIDVVVLT